MDSALKTEIWFIDDDLDDHELLRDVFAEMNWQYTYRIFQTGEAFLKELEGQPMAPFIIVCSVSLSKMSGFEIREELLRRKMAKFNSVPFIFWSNESSQKDIKKAFALMAHGFFLKGTTFHDWKAALKIMVEYWRMSETPVQEYVANGHK